jgi:hypothetical protein
MPHLGGGHHPGGDGLTPSSGGGSTSRVTRHLAAVSPRGLAPRRAVAGSPRAVEVVSLPAVEARSPAVLAAVSHREGKDSAQVPSGRIVPALVPAAEPTSSGPGAGVFSAIVPARQRHLPVPPLGRRRPRLASELPRPAVMRAWAWACRWGWAPVTDRTAANASARLGYPRTRTCGGPETMHHHPCLAEASWGAVHR